LVVVVVVMVLAAAVEYAGPDLSVLWPLSCNIYGSHFPLPSLILRNLKELKSVGKYFYSHNFVL
jgi:hypothetical protein